MTGNPQTHIQENTDKIFVNEGFETDVTSTVTTTKNRKTPLLKKKSSLELNNLKENKRTRHLVGLRECAEKFAVSGKLETCHVSQLLADQEFSRHFFCLFDGESTGRLDQQKWIDHIKNTTLYSFSSGDSKRDGQMREMVEMLEAITFMMYSDQTIGEQEFFKVWNTKCMAGRLVAAMDKNQDGELTLEEVMAFITLLTSSQRTGGLNEDDIRRLEQLFRANLKPGQDEFTLAEFKRILPSKNSYFVERSFAIFDKDCSGTVSLEEFLETMKQFAIQGHDEKIAFLFKVYDPNGDGVIEEDELCSVLAACLAESGMNLDTEAIADLASALYEDAVKEGSIGITADDLKEQLERHEGLLENLSLAIGKWFVPPQPPRTLSLWEKLGQKMPHQLSAKYAANNRPTVLFLFFLLTANVLLFSFRANYFREFPWLTGYTPNRLYMISRGFGLTLHFNSQMLLILVLRYSLTLLRNLGLASFLPLDQNIFFHKRIGQIILIQAWIHSVMHFINFGLNIQPDPVKFLQLSGHYWKGAHTNWTTLGYIPPQGCTVVSVNSTFSRNCLNSSFFADIDTDLTADITHCQACESHGEPWSYSEWILTQKPGVLGLISGCANPTGVALLVILSVIFLGSMNVVRRSGYFQVFYISHLLNFCYWVLLAFHAPNFWKWFIVPGSIYVTEILYRVMTSLIGQGKSKVVSVELFPSKVTSLIIRRPAGFKFNPGDWVFIKIPDIAIFEWHAFTISSAPEVVDTFTLHIRGVGEWTNKLFKHCQAISTNSNKGPGTVRNTIKGIKKHITVKKLRPVANPSGREFQQMLQQLPTTADSSSGELPNTQSSSSVIQVTTDNPSSRSNDENRSGNITTLSQKMQIYIDGPFGSPSSNIYRAEHAVLIGTGIGVTPFASILQSIMKRYKQVKHSCPGCQYTWSDNMTSLMLNLKKVDFFWINRDHTSFEWFLKLLTEMELEQAETGGEIGRFLDMHMYVTSALQRNDMKAVMLQLAMDLHHKKAKRDMVTGLKSRMNAGRPNWNKVFTQIRAQHVGKVTVFFCGNPSLAKAIRLKCDEFGFLFRKEVF